MRRLALFALSAAVVAGASACATVDPPAASFPSVQISNRDFRAEVQHLADAELPLGGQSPAGGRPGTVAAKYSRDWLSQRLVFEIGHAIAVEAGITATAEEIEAQRQQLQQAFQSSTGGPNPWDALPQDLQTYVATRQAEIAALQASPKVEELNGRAVALAKAVKVDPRYGVWDPDNLEVAEHTRA